MQSNQEPSVLDYLKSKLSFKRGPKIQIPQSEPALFADIEGTESEPQKFEEPSLDDLAPAAPVLVVKTAERFTFPWRTFVALFLALIAQRLLEPPNRSIQPAIFLYVFAVLWVGMAIWKKEWVLPELQDFPVIKIPLTFRLVPLIISVPLILLAFLTFTNDTFTFLNVTLWVLAIIYVLLAFWLTDPSARPWKERLKSLWKPTWNIRITRWTLLVILVAAVVVFFRAYRLDSVLGEMFSDHAEKLLDVMDVLNGKYSIFFPRNTGREAIQFYLSAGIATLFNTGISFLTLKLGTMLIGLATLPFVYLLGKEVANKWVGLTAFFLTGVAYWANLIARIGLRFPLYPCFAAPTLYFLIRGIRRSNRNDFILAGIALGLGLHGYSPARFLPFVVVAAVIIYLLHKQSKGNRKEVIVSLVILALVSFVVFLPLFRYWVDNPDMFGYRAFSRLGSTERPLPGPILAIFFSNTWKAMIMPFFDNGNIWVHSIPGRPALDFISAALFMLGLVVVIARYIKKRDWVDLFLLISIPLLLMPSILSLAFPDENPSLNRTGAAYIPIFIIAAMGLDGALAAIKRSMSNWIGTALTGVVAFGLVLGICFNNYNLVFNQFEKQFMEGALDTTDIGAVIHEFATTVGARDSAFVVPYPYWVDTRLVGIHAGFPDKDYALWPDGFKDTQDIKGAKLFIFNPEDTKDIQALQQQYPSGILTRFKTKQDGKDFMMLFVPPEKAK